MNWVCPAGGDDCGYYIYGAYAAAWAIHIVYLIILTRGYQRVRDDIDDLNRS